MALSHFDELGGEQRLRPIIDRFVDRIFEDVMIGYLFQRANRARIKQKEYEFAAQHLGATIEYTGRPLATAHAAHAIFSGHFGRRLQILRETLSEFQVPEHIATSWLAHVESLRSQITKNPAGVCEPEKQ